MKFPKNLNTLASFNAVASNKKIVLFGGGNLCMKCLNTFLQGRDISYIVDNNSSLTGTKLYGIDIVSPDRLSQENTSDIVILITSIFIKAIMAQIETYGNFDVFSGRILINTQFNQVAYDLFEHQKELEQVEGMLCDEISRHIFSECVYRRLTGEKNFSDLQLKAEPQYLLHSFHQNDPPKNEIIIDCGAYTGDTLKKFVDVYENTLVRYYAFEPTTDSLKILEKAVHHYSQRNYAPNIIIMPYGVLDEETTVDFALVTERSTPNFIINARKSAINNFWDSNRCHIKTVKLDDVIPADEKITLIKMDIEESEYPALLGAERIIKMYKPRLAISIYHSGLDYFRVALLIKRFVPEYKLAVRHHHKTHYDTVLYAYI